MSIQSINTSAKAANGAGFSLTGDAPVESSFAFRQAETEITNFYKQWPKIGTTPIDTESIKSSGITLRDLKQVTQAYGTVTQYDSTTSKAQEAELERQTRALQSESLLAYGDETKSWEVQTALLEGYQRQFPKYPELAAQEGLDDRVITDFNKRV